MDNKRFFLALALSMVVFIGWQMLFPPQPQPGQNATDAAVVAETKKASLVEGSGEANVVKVNEQDFVPTQGRQIKVTTPLYTAVFNTQGGILEKFVLDNYRETLNPQSPLVDLIGPKAVAKGPLGLIINTKGVENHTWLKGEWAYEGGDVNIAADAEPTTLTFVGQAAGFRVERRLTFDPTTYLINEDVTLTNLGQTGVEASVAFTAAAKSMSAEDDKYNPTRVAWADESGRDEIANRDDLKETGASASVDFKWAAIESNYFLFAIVPGGDKAAMYAGVQDDIFRMAVDETATFLPNVEKTLKSSYFIGPCERQLLAKAPNGLADAVDFGFFDILAKPMLIALNFFYGYVHNYGIAIILLTIVLKIAFWPLSQKSYESMEQMKRLQPMVAKLREKYGDDKQRLNQETMALYKTYKVNPAGGCLPMLLQIPVFFGLYKALLGAIELRHAPFITHLPFTDLAWLADLSAKDPYYITPLIMGATMFLQQKMTPSAGDPTQQKIMLLMPVVFTFMFLQFPSGLVIYWLMNNILSIGQQWLMIAKNKKKAAA